MTMRDSNPWKPQLCDVFAEHLGLVEPGKPAREPGKFMLPALRKLTFVGALFAFVFRQVPPFRDAPPSAGLLWQMLLGRGDWDEVGAITAGWLQQQFDTIQLRGPLGICMPAQAPAAFFTDAARIPDVPPELLPDPEKAIYADFVKGDASDPSTIIEQADAARRRHWLQEIEGYERAKQDRRPWSQSSHPRNALQILEVARRHTALYLSARVFVALEPEGIPSLMNETFHHTATVHSVAISVVMEFLRHYRATYGGISSSHPLITLSKELTGPDNWVLATLGDLIWMHLIYPQWLHKEEGAESADPDSALFLLLRNPIFVLEDADARLQRYPTDDVARKQMLLFLATCSHTYRQFLIEQLFECSPSEDGKDPRQGHGRAGKWIACLRQIVMLWTRSSEFERTPSEDGKDPWQGHRRAGKWIACLRETVMPWAESFEPVSDVPATDAVPAAAVRSFLADIVNLWIAQTLRLGLFLIAKERVEQPPDDVQDIFSQAKFYLLRSSLSMGFHGMEHFDSARCLGVSTFPLRFNGSLAAELLKTPGSFFKEEKEDLPEQKLLPAKESKP